MASARVAMPQSWNRYAYVLNNPLAYIDPNGTEFVHKTKDGVEQYEWATGTELEGLRNSGWADVTYDANGSFAYDVTDSSGHSTGEIYELHSNGDNNWLARIVSNAEFNRGLADEAFKRQLAGNISTYALAMFLGPLIEGIIGSSVAEQGLATNTAAEDAFVVHGGQNLPENFINGSGVAADSKGNLHGVSVNSAPGRTVEELSVGIRNGRIGVSTVGEVRAAGGLLSPTGTRRNPYHCDLCNLSAGRLSKLFTPTITNPSK